MLNLPQRCGFKLAKVCVSGVINPLPNWQMPEHDLQRPQRLLELESFPEAIKFKEKPSCVGMDF